MALVSDKSGEIELFLAGLILATVLDGQFEGLIDGQRAAIGGGAVFDDFGGENGVGIAARIAGIDGEGVGLAEDLLLGAGDQTVDLTVGGFAMMGGAAAGQEQGKPARARKEQVQSAHGMGSAGARAVVRVRWPGGGHAGRAREGRVIHLNDWPSSCMTVPAVLV